MEYGDVIDDKPRACDSDNSSLRKKCLGVDEPHLSGFAIGFLTSDGVGIVQVALICNDGVGKRVPHALHRSHTDRNLHCCCRSRRLHVVDSAAFLYQ